MADSGGAALWQTLRRRKVVQWGLAYAAGAWALIQVISHVVATFHWPEQIQQLATLILLLGLPVSLILAWYHGDRGQQHVTGTELAVLALLCLLAGGVLWLYGQRSAPTVATSPAVTVAEPATTAMASADARPSIAVLPFENRSDQSKDAFFAEGIHDDILTQLSKVSALRVISRTSVQRFRKTTLSAQDVAAQLGVTRILEGGVQRAGDRVRIHVQLIDAATDTHLWAESYDRELTAANIFAIQSEVATAVVGALQATLTPAEQARVNAIPTQDLKAWQAYQLGKERLAQRTSAALMEAEQRFRKAVALDAKFALAWVGLADALVLQPLYSGEPKDAALHDAEQAANRALELDPNLAEAWTSAGNIAGERLEFGRAEWMLRRAIALNPNYAPAYHWLSFALTELGRRDEALAAAEHAVVLDPLSAIINARLGVARTEVGRFDDALAALGQAVEIEPTMAASYLLIADLHAYAFGRLDTAMAWYERAASLDPRDPDILASMAFAYWDLQDSAEAGQWLTRALAEGDGTTYTHAVASLLYRDRGDEAASYRHAQRAAELDPWNTFLVRDHDIRKRDYAAARARYAKAYPELFADDLPAFEDRRAFAAIDLALVLQHTGEGQRARALLDRSESYLGTLPRRGPQGYGFSDVAIHALRGETAAALVSLRQAEQAGLRTWWRYYRDFDPNLGSIRHEPEFKAVFADIERDMAAQRVRLAARPKDAPPDLQVTPREPGTHGARPP